ncbi:MAG: hypothetical protein ACPLN2_06815 [Thermoproteota archaeon]
MPPEPAYEERGVKHQRNAGTSCEGMLPAKRVRGRSMKPNLKKKLEVSDLSRGEDVTYLMMQEPHTSFF